jgi:type I restriction enzyme S subunit
LSKKATTEIIPGVAALSVGLPDRPPPPGWRWVRLTDVARLESGHTPSRKHPEYWDGDIPWLTLPDARAHHGTVITQTTQTISEAGLANSAARLLPADTVCLSRTASVGNVTRLGRPMATSQDFVNWVCSPELEPRFLQYAILAEGDHLLDFGKGTTHTTIYFPAVLAFHICMPARAEQERIVEKVDALLAKVSAARERLTRVREILKRFRQSVLAAACSGRLTDEWRRVHGQQAPSRDDPKRRPSLRTDGADEDQLESPVEWRRLRLGELLCLVTSGSRGWSRYYDDKGSETFVMAQNVRPMDLDLRSRVGLRLPKADSEKDRTRIQRDDLLVTIVGANTGDVCRVGKDLSNHYVCQSVALLRPTSTASSGFLELWLNSPLHGQQQLLERAYGEGRPHLGLDDVRDIAVALPSSLEQKQLVSRADTLFERGNQLDARVTAALRRAEALTAAVLVRAFRGELVAYRTAPS